MKLSVILPASNEAEYIGSCLQALLASEPVAGGAEVIVVANGCRDATADVARSFAPAAGTAGWGLRVLERAEGGKTAALTSGDGLALGEIRAYLDADVCVSPPLMAALTRALAGRSGAAYGSGQAVLPPAKSMLSRAYGRFWQSLPFNRDTTAPGYGLFAVNEAGRARWGAFPQIISDDTFVRLSFAPPERLSVPYSYTWPLAEGFARLVRVRRRQNQGVAEIAALYPHLLANSDHPRLSAGGLAALALREPTGFLAYGLVALAVRLGRAERGWTRGR
ncbi:glycosyltransferase family 2 protein [Falsigemmobacter faecalis]|uniref:Glycosyltransferase n=1 Tax=Falsigemmobacter faecalis TaxID=2488730 RepID=A0A3P3DUT7_9RHOB|nr:glycosyltransferase [Falsigemmobacter faecalis]RRH77935.1 glycosyltransferase [Falsigemmobacter faecalis]